VFGLCARGEFIGGDALKWVDGLVSGKTCKDGGGTPEGKLWFAEAKDAKGLAMLSEDSNWEEVSAPAPAPPAAKTAGGIA
jgi:hypothetical protein